MSRDAAALLLFVAGVAAFVLALLSGSELFVGLLFGCAFGSVVCGGIES